MKVLKSPLIQQVEEIIKSNVDKDFLSHLCDG